MFLQDHQGIAFVRSSREDKHIHLYVNRIDYTGKAYDDQFISNRSAHVAEGIAKDMGLKTAKEIQQGRSKERQLNHPEMEYIKELAKATLAQRRVNSIPQFVSLFNQAGAAAGFRAEAYNNKNGSFQGLRFYAGEHKFKASEIDRSLSKQNLEHTLERQLMEDTDREVVLANSKETQQAAQEMENGLQEKSSSHKSERIMDQTFGLINALLSANPYQVDPQIKQDPDPEEEERKKKLKKKRPFTISRF